MFLTAERDIVSCKCRSVDSVLNSLPSNVERVPSSVTNCYIRCICVFMLLLSHDIRVIPYAVSKCTVSETDKLSYIPWICVDYQMEDVIPNNMLKEPWI